MQRATRTQALIAGFTGISLLAVWAVSASAQSRPSTPAPQVTKELSEKPTPALASPDRIVRTIPLYTL